METILITECILSLKPTFKIDICDCKKLFWDKFCWKHDCDDSLRWWLVGGEWWVPSQIVGWTWKWSKLIQTLNITTTIHPYTGYLNITTNPTLIQNKECSFPPNIHFIIFSITFAQSNIWPLTPDSPYSTLPASWIS